MVHLLHLDQYHLLVGVVEQTQEIVATELDAMADLVVEEVQMLEFQEPEELEILGDIPRLRDTMAEGTEGLVHLRIHLEVEEVLEELVEAGTDLQQAEVEALD
jgi:hypothetical protein